MRGSISAATTRSRGRPAPTPGSSSTSTSSTSGKRHDHELGDPHPRLDDERLARVGVEQDDPQLAAVAGVDQARRVDDRDPVLRRQAGARLDEACVALRDRHREARRDQRPLAGTELDALAGREIEAGVARVGAPGQHGVVPQPLDRQLDQALSRVASATRYGAKRGSSRRGRRATTSTPSGVSSRCSIGAPSA